jgi:hypothetical protein
MVEKGRKLTIRKYKPPKLMRSHPEINCTKGTKLSVKTTTNSYQF